MCTGTGKCLNFEVGGRFYTSCKDALGFRGQTDHFVLEIDRNEDGDVADEGESAIYDFEPAQDDLGPQVMYISQKCLSDANTQDTLIEERGEPENPYDKVGELINNPTKDTKENRMYDVLFKVSGKVVDRANAYFAIDDGTGLSVPTTIFTLDDRTEAEWNPYNPTAVGQYWETWGLLERFRPVGDPPYILKPFLVWTSKSHDRKLLNAP